MELRECPFCGGPAHEGGAYGDGWIVECASSGYDCPVNPDVFGFDRAEAVARWNRRASDRYTVTDQGRAMLKDGK